MAAKVFLCYRRDDSAGYAGRVQDRLVQEFGRDLLFMDVDAIPLGVNFATTLRNEVAKCEVLLAVIGRTWLDARDEDGNRRLDDPHDFVRIEIGAALQRNIPVIPILLDGAKVPKANQLPKDLEELSLRNGLDVRHASFHNDLDRLVRGLKGQLAETDGEKRRAVEDELRRQEAENKRRLDEAEAEKRRQDEDGRRRQEMLQAKAGWLEEERRTLQDAQRQRREEESRRLQEEGKRPAKEAQRRTQLEQGPLPKSWLLPLVGAGAASALMLLLAAISLPELMPLFVATIYALYGGAAGMLVWRFSVPKAVAIPIIPALILLLVLANKFSRGMDVVLPLVVWFVLAIACAWWAFSLWGRKRHIGPGS